MSTPGFPLLWRVFAVNAALLALATLAGDRQSARPTHRGTRPRVRTRAGRQRRAVAPRGVELTRYAIRRGLIQP